MRPHADGHWSGLADATDQQWRRLTREAAQHCSLFAATECRLHCPPFGWGQYRPIGVRGGEGSIFWDHHDWQTAGPRADSCGAVSLTKKTFYTGQGHERPGVILTYGNLEQARGRTLLRAVGHLPASVQHGDYFSDQDRRVAAWKDAVGNIRPVLERLADEYRPDEITASFDFNVDLTREAWRNRINHALRGTDLRLKAPDQGTHHDRAIDGHLSTMRRHPSGNSRVYPRLKPFDHQLVVATLTTKEKNR